MCPNNSSLLVPTIIGTLAIKPFRIKFSGESAKNLSWPGISDSITGVHMNGGESGKSCRKMKEIEKSFVKS